MKKSFILAVAILGITFAQATTKVEVKNPIKQQFEAYVQSSNLP